MSHYMTDDEICMYYDQAADQASQVGILAELNACEVEEIEEVLWERGRISKPPRRAPKRHIKKRVQRRTVKSWEAEEIRAIIRMSEDGLSIMEIAEETGRTYESINSKLYGLRKSGRYERELRSMH